MRRIFKPGLTRPEDFDAFWDSTRLQLEHLDPAIDRRPGPAAPFPGAVQETVSFASLGLARVSAMLLRWEDDTPRPLVIGSHGYGGQCRARWDWARRGVNVFSVDIRGFGISRDALPHPSRWGYVLTGIESPETSVIRLAVCDYMQSARVARLPPSGPLLGAGHALQDIGAAETDPEGPLALIDGLDLRARQVDLTTVQGIASWCVGGMR